MRAVEANKLSKVYSLSRQQSEFVALDGVSFSISEGESVGIIGHNGAGKSTLLKLLSGITYPTSGDGKVVGSFSSLLEIGTGFHPDLSGLDNIFLNASILGISKAETHSNLQEIIAFSGIEKFIDQPIRTYSSGMKLRLAFSIIAHLKTDIIALDEVLAVGDSMFQTKCIERIFDFKHQGRTILFVSHNLSAVKKLCERTLVLQNGKLIFDGKTDEAIEYYLGSNRSELTSNSIKFLNSINSKSDKKTATITIELSDLPSNDKVDLGINICGKNGEQLYHFSNRFSDDSIVPNSGRVNCELTFSHQLKPGDYQVNLYVGQNEEQLIWLENATMVSIPPYSPYGFHNPDAIQAPIITEFTIKSK